MNYKQAGVNIEEGYRAVEQYRELANATADAAVLDGVGGFAGLYSLAAFNGMKEPVLVSGADGVGTKLEIAFQLGICHTIGIDCVAMCVNDILCQGARPLFFLDYLACGKLDAARAADIVKGVASGCREAGCALLGGETAEMPGFYETGKYDVAGFAVGIVDWKNIINGARVREGDVLLGIASSGAHSNGFSLIRRVIPNINEDFGGMRIGQALLEPTRIYVRPVLALMEQIEIHGIAHITGGGFYENIPRLFAGRAFDAVINPTAWRVPPLFARIACGAAHDGAEPKYGGDAEREGAALLRDDEDIRRLMFNTFNMGIGLVLALDRQSAGPAIAFLEERGFPSWEIGEVTTGSGGLRFA